MKKRILLLAAIAVSAASFAQQKTSFSVRGGYVSSNITGDANQSLEGLMDFSNGAITTKNHTGFYAGGSVSVPLSTNFAIESGLGYAQKGYTAKGELTIKGASFLSPSAKANLNLNYIEMPLLVKANFNGLELFAGPQVAYLASAKLRTTAGALGFNVLDKTMDAADQFHQWDAGVTGGVGYQFSNGLNLRASYERGLTKVDSDRSFDAYNQAFKVGVGFRF